MAFGRCLLKVDSPARRTYRDGVSKEQLTQEAMALPLAERVSLAQDRWQSLEQTNQSNSSSAATWPSQRQVPHKRFTPAIAEFRL